MLEEYVIGDQLSVEGIFVKKKYYPIAFADRNYTVHDLRKAKGVGKLVQKKASTFEQAEPV